MSDEERARRVAREIVTKHFGKEPMIAFPFENECQQLILAALVAARSEGKPRLSDEAAAQVMWANLCCVRPVGCGDGDTYFVQAPTQSEFVAVVYPALATVRAEEREACEAIARAEEVANPSINGTIAAQRIKSAIRARP